MRNGPDMSEQPQPLAAIPLEYSSIAASNSLPRSIRGLVLAMWVSVAVSPPLIAVISTEVIIITGIIESVLAVTLVVNGAVRRTWWLLGIALAHLFLASAVFLLINLRDWSPREATTPVAAIAVLAAIMFAWPTWRVFVGERR